VIRPEQVRINESLIFCGGKKNHWPRFILSFNWEEVRKANIALEIFAEEDEEGL